MPGLEIARELVGAAARTPIEVADLSDLETLARYHRERLALYRARLHGSHPTSAVRLHELERAASAAGERLRTARRPADRRRQPGAFAVTSGSSPVAGVPIHVGAARGGLPRALERVRSGE